MPESVKECKNLGGKARGCGYQYGNREMHASVLSGNILLIPILKSLCSYV